MSSTALYRQWRGMHERCYSPAHISYPTYGGRGITVSPEWHDFETFARDMGPRPSTRHSIDRVDNNGPYGPTNCRWATALEQNRNSRNCTVKGWELAAAMGVRQRTIYATRWRNKRA